MSNQICQPGSVPIGSRLIWKRTVDSTNRLALELARADKAVHGTVILADHQTAGRGRRGRVWLDTPGTSLLFSVVLQPNAEPRRSGQLVLMGAVAVARAIREVTGLPARVKWPNDILIRERKVSGTLVETQSTGDRVEVAVIGIGINCNQEGADFPPELREQTTSLALELGTAADRPALLEAVLVQLGHQYTRFCHGAGEELARDWRELATTLGKRVKITDSAGCLIGTAEDITAEGLLLVRRLDGTQCTVAVGEVTLRPADDV